MSQSNSVQVRSTKSKRTRPLNSVLFWSPDCRYDVVLNNARTLNQNNEGYTETSPRWELIDDEKYESKANVYWVDVASILERFRSIQPWQVMNHFPGMPNIARKNRMGQNLNRMLKLFPKEYAFYPKTWVLPGEINDFRQQFDEKGNSLNNKIFIIKPDAGCQGRGIFLTRTFENVPQSENVVAQVYIKKPLLLDGFKFDLRLYCLVTSVKPLRMYLFQDGLVRMCTEEYEKPNKQNIAMSCMHLTNYAVNKHNSNFQQPSAKSSKEYQDDGSKRSLKWFLNYISDQHGESKAAWLWRRMGTLCVRSVLSIMPTLSREYDQHFKSFSGIPFVVPEYNVSLAFGSDRVNSINRKTNSLENEIVSRSDEENEDKDDAKTRKLSMSNADRYMRDMDTSLKPDVTVSNADTSTDRDPSSSSSSGANNKPSTPKADYPSIRGSRCFEVLGFDVMIDSNLKPWIIEVNHLPSFGTDSPLDLDIKDRLMKEVLRCVAALPDDEVAYSNHHKAEASRRLIESKERHKEAPPPAKKPPAKRYPASIRMKSVSTNDKNNYSSVVESVIVEPFDTGFCAPERLEEIKLILKDIYEKRSPDKVCKIDRLLAKYEFREEEFLKYVYAKYDITPPWMAATSASATSVPAPDTDTQAVNSMQSHTIDRRESLTTEGEQTENGELKPLGHVDDTQVGHEDSNCKQLQGKGLGASSDNKEKDKIRESRSHSTSSSFTRRGVARSLSPPSGKTNRASWKMQAEEEVVYRREVMAAHYPKPDDEWMQREISILTQFSRIFPPEVSTFSTNATVPTSSSSKVNGGNYASGLNATSVGEDDMLEIEGRDQDDDNDNDDDDEYIANTAGDTTNTSSSKQESPNKSRYNSSSNSNGNGVGASSSTSAQESKPISFEEILYQVFLQDKRQTLRLRCPLPARIMKPTDIDTQSLPPLERSKGHLHNSLAANAGKGAVGWKLPPSVNGSEQKKDTVSVKVPTQSQLEAANRLSKGLSVAEQQHKYLKNRQPITPKTMDPSIIIDQKAVIPNTINIANVTFASITNQSHSHTTNITPTIGIGVNNNNSLPLSKYANGMAGGGQRLGIAGQAEILANPVEYDIWNPLSAKVIYSGPILRQQAFKFEGVSNANSNPTANGILKKEQRQMHNPYNPSNSHRQGDNLLYSMNQMFNLNNGTGISPSNKMNNGVPLHYSQGNGNGNGNGSHSGDSAHITPKNVAKTVNLGYGPEKEDSFKQLFPVWFNNPKA